MKAYGFEEDDLEIAEPQINKPVNNTQSPAKMAHNFKTFKEESSSFPDQKAIDDFIESFTADELQGQAKNIFGSVMELVNNASSYEEIQEKLSEQGLDTEKTEKVLQKAIFISEIFGRLSTINENT